MTGKIKPNADTRPLRLLLFVSPYIIGLYFEWASAAASLFLLTYLAFAFTRNKTLCIPNSPTLLAVTVLLGFYAVSSLWAVDKGMSVFGFVKFLPLPLFALALAQTDKTERMGMLDVIPLSGACMTVLSFCLAFVPALRDYIMIEGRLAGFMQYPNSFALFLLTGVVVLMTRGKTDAKSIVLLAVELFGIAASGSRTCFALLVLCIIVLLVRHKNKKLKLVTAGLMLLLIAGTGIYAILIGDVSSVARYLTTSLSSRSLLLRFLFYRDALPVVLTHPFGLGYMGYYFLQGSFQSGLYSAVYVHNELLQIFLDVGWIPAGFAVWALVQTFRRRNENMTGFAVTAVIFAHCMLDFSLQNVSIGLILLCAMGVEGKKERLIKSRPAAAVLSALLCAVSLYFGAVSGAYYAKNYEAALTLYPRHTLSALNLLPEIEDEQELDRLAERILRVNDSAALAYDAAARAAFARGDIEKMIVCKQNAIEHARMRRSEYLDYCSMLCSAYAMYVEAGDIPSAEYCRERILEIPEMLDEARDSITEISRKARYAPGLKLPEEYMAVIEDLK